MGRAQQKRGPADPMADELRWYFQESEGDMGVASSFGGFVNLAMSGIQGGGRSNGAERRAVAIADWGSTGAHRRIRKMLQDLSARDPRLVHALWMAYGPIDWVRMADAAFGRGTGERMVRALGASYIGVALLTHRLAEAQAEAAPIPTAASDGANRWELASVTKAGEPTYRCAGPTMEVRDQRILETDEELRRRVTEVAVRECHGLLDALPLIKDAGLDEAAKALGMNRKHRQERRIVATGRAVREEAPPDLGRVLWRLAAAAYPNKAPRSPKQKASVEAALRQVTAIRDEAVMLLQRARNAMDACASERSVERRTERKRARSSVVARRVCAQVRGPSRPVQMFPAPEGIDGAASGLAMAPERSHAEPIRSHAPRCL